MLGGILAVFAVLSFAAACGDDDSSSKTNTPASGATSAATSGATQAATQSAPSGKITIVGTQFERWDPHAANFAQDIAHFYMVWRGLYEFDLQYKPIPSMAEAAPQISADGKTYTVKLKSGLKWSDGSAMTADDFVAGIWRTCSPDTAGDYQSLLFVIPGCEDFANSNGDAKATPPKPAADAAKKDQLMKAIGVRAVDPQTVEYKLTNPQGSFTTFLAMWMTMPVPSAKVKTADKWPAPTAALYNGPFMVKDYTEKDHLTLVPNPNWSGKEKAQVEQITIRYIDKLDVAMAAYRNGEVDATAANLSEFDVIKKEFGGKDLQTYPATRTIGLEYNLKDPVMANKNLRIALSKAVNRKDFNDVALKGANTPTTSWMPEDRSGVKEGTYDSLVGFDAAAAKAALQASGLDPAKTSITLLLVDSPTNKDVGAFLQNAWKTVLGLDVKTEFVDSATRSGRFNKGDYQLTTGGWQEDYPDPENWFLPLWVTGASSNKTFTSLPALDDLAKKAQFNTKDEERRQQYRDMEKLLLDGANGMAPLYHSVNNRLVKPYLKGLTENKRAGDTFVPGDWNPERWSTTKK